MQKDCAYKVQVQDDLALQIYRITKLTIDNCTIVPLLMSGNCNSNYFDAKICLVQKFTNRFMLKLNTEKKEHKLFS